jgi:putative transposase
MSEKYKFHNPEGIYFITSTVVHWIDVFTRKECKHIILESLQYCQEQKGLVIHGWCLMESHLHLIVSTTGQPLAAILRDFKKYTSRQLVKTLQEINESRKEWLLRAFTKAGEKLNRVQQYKVWQDGNHPLLLENNYLQEQKLNYLHQNPVQSEIVEEPEQYLYSSARDYVGYAGLLKVMLLA